MGDVDRRGGNGREEQYPGGLTASDRGQVAATVGRVELSRPPNRHRGGGAGVRSRERTVVKCRRAPAVGDPRGTLKK